MKRFFLILALCALTACANHKDPLTVAPHSVVSTSSSFDGNARNSGVLYCDANGCVVTQHFIERHQINTTDHGVTSQKDGYRLTAEQMAKAIEFDRIRKNAQK